MIVVLKVQKQVTFFTISRLRNLEWDFYLTRLHVETDCSEEACNAPPAAFCQCCL